MGTDGWATRDHLLDVGRALVAERGASFSLREVARRAEVSPAAVYRHFASKDALVAALTRIGVQSLWLDLLRAGSEATPRARLVASAAAYVGFARRAPADYRATFMTAGVARGDEAFHYLVDRVREVVGARRDPTTVAREILAVVHGFASLHLCGQLPEVRDERRFEEVWRRALDRLLADLEVNSVHKLRGRRSPPPRRRGRSRRSSSAPAGRTSRRCDR